MRSRYLFLIDFRFFENDEFFFSFTLDVSATEPHARQSSSVSDVLDDFPLTTQQSMILQSYFLSIITFSNKLLDNVYKVAELSGLTEEYVKVKFNPKLDALLAL